MRLRLPLMVTAVLAGAAGGAACASFRASPEADAASADAESPTDTSDVATDARVGAGDSGIVGVDAEVFVADSGIMPNGDFELGCTMVNPDLRATVVATHESHSGSTACRVCSVEPGADNAAFFAFTAGNALGDGGSYVGEAWVKSAEGGAPFTTPIITAGVAGDRASANGFPMSDTWTKLTVPYTSNPADDAGLALLVGLVADRDAALPSGLQCFVVDDIALWPRP